MEDCWPGGQNTVLTPDRHHWESHRFSGPHRGAGVGPDAGHRPLRFCKVQKGEE